MPTRCSRRSKASMRQATPDGLVRVPTPGSRYAQHPSPPALLVGDGDLVPRGGAELQRVQLPRTARSRIPSPSLFVNGQSGEPGRCILSGRAAELSYGMSRDPPSSPESSQRKPSKAGLSSDERKIAADPFAVFSEWAGDADESLCKLVGSRHRAVN